MVKNLDSGAMYKLVNSDKDFIGLLTLIYIVTISGKYGQKQDEVYWGLLQLKSFLNYRQPDVKDTVNIDFCDLYRTIIGIMGKLVLSKLN